MWAQVTALWQVHDLAREHAASLRQARETIVRVWPPQVSEASAAYLAELDGLIAARDGLVAASAANAQALAGVLTVLEHAKARVDDLHEKWRALDEVSPTQMAALGGLGLLAVATGGAAAGLAGPVLDLTGNDAEKAQLNAQAQAVMRETDTAAYAYLPRMVIPTAVDQSPDPRYSFTPVNSGSSGDGGSSSGRAGVRPPVIPEPASAALVPDPVSPVTGLMLTGSGGLPGHGEGPGVGGSNPGPAASGAGDGVLPEVGPDGREASWFVDTLRGRVLRVGGVVGATPDQVGSGASGAVRRVAGSQPESARVGGAATEPVGGLWGAGAGGVGRMGDRRYQRRVPPETVWPVHKGVSPVLEPPPEREIVHDPGPGVIGIDR